MLEAYCFCRQFWKWTTFFLKANVVVMIHQTGRKWRKQYLQDVFTWFNIVYNQLNTKDKDMEEVLLSCDITTGVW